MLSIGTVYNAIVCPTLPLSKLCLRSINPVLFYLGNCLSDSHLQTAIKHLTESAAAADLMTLTTNGSDFAQTAGNSPYAP
jgi:hypothetical protein